MHTLSLGPFFSNGKSAEHEGDGMSRIGCHLEFATPEAAAVAPIYYRHDERSRPGIWNLFVFAADIPYPVNYHPGFAQSTSRGLFLPLNEVLLFLYRTYSVRRLVSDLLTELRSKITSPVLL